MPKKESALRLDKMLQEKTGLSRKKVKRLLDEGRVLLNNRKVVIASWDVHPRDQIKILAEGEESLPQADRHFLKVIHEDHDLLVIEKDPGLSCEKSAVATRPSIVSVINAYLKRKYPHLKGHYVGLVHRLDQGTSGLMVYTKTKEANKITDQFKRHTIRRKYLAIVEGRVDKENGIIEGYLKKSDLLQGGRKVTVSTPESGRHAVTRFQVKERYQNATLVEIRLDTGRTHQIRVHMASIKHPVAGDKNYGDHKAPRITFSRQALHASFLGFHHPITGQKMEFSSELPRDLRKLIDRLRMAS